MSNADAKRDAVALMCEAMNAMGEGLGIDMKFSVWVLYDKGKGTVSTMGNQDIYGTLRTLKRAVARVEQQIIEAEKIPTEAPPDLRKE